MFYGIRDLFPNGIFGVLFALVFLLILSVFIVLLVRGLRQWNKNNHSPRLTVPARVVSRRASTSTTMHPVGGDASGAGGFTQTSSTTYYVTFEFESGDRMEFHVPSHEYAYLVEGDFGRLSFQGTRFLGFQRT